MEEQEAFSSWVNCSFRNDPDLKKILPIKSDLLEKLKDGILLWCVSQLNKNRVIQSNLVIPFLGCSKIINYSVPGSIDERTIHKKNLTLYRKHENLTLALVSARSIGLNVINIDAHDLAKGTPHLVLALLWQIIHVNYQME